MKVKPKEEPQKNIVVGTPITSDTPGEDQEAYLKVTSTKDILIRGGKKIITEITSVKTLALGGIFVLLFLQKIDAMWGIIGITTLTGVREIPIDAIVNLYKNKINGKNGGKK
jgi:hypothetical protein